MKINYHSKFQVIVFLILLLSSTYAGSEERIIGGEAVQDSSIYPWMIAIVDADTNAVDGLMCGGVLVAPYLVLTAAHCVDHVDDTDSVNVIIGTVDLENVNNAEIIGVDSTIMYPHYFNSWIDTNTYTGGDLGFLVLSDSSNIVNTYINIPDEITNGEPGDSVIVLGYSYTVPDSLSHFLKQAGILIQPLDTCKNYFGAPSTLYPELHVCAGNDDGDGACGGDSGGPLVLNHEGSHILNGIVSGGTNLSCSFFSGPEDFYGIYVNVFEFRGWIKSIIDGDTFTDVSFWNKDEQNNDLSNRLKINSYHPIVISGETVPVPISSSLSIDTHSQLLSNSTFQHYRWNSNYSEYKLSHDRVFTTQITEDIARFKTLDSILITNDHEITMSIKDPWYVSGGEQDNDFYTISDSTYEVFLDQNPLDFKEYYAIRTVQFIGTDSLGFDIWQAYDDQDIKPADYNCVIHTA